MTERLQVALSTLSSSLTELNNTGKSVLTRATTVKASQVKLRDLLNSIVRMLTDNQNLRQKAEQKIGEEEKKMESMLKAVEDGLAETEDLREQLRITMSNIMEILNGAPSDEEVNATISMAERAISSLNNAQSAPNTTRKVVSKQPGPPGPNVMERGGSKKKKKKIKKNK